MELPEDEDAPDPPADRVVYMRGVICSTGMWSTEGVPILTTDLPVSAELRARLTRWADWYDDEDSRADAAGIPNPGSPWEARGVPVDAFNIEGRALARALKDELGPEWTVIVSDVDAWRYRDDPEGRCLELPAERR